MKLNISQSYNKKIIMLTVLIISGALIGSLVFFNNENEPTYAYIEKTKIKKTQLEDISYAIVQSNSILPTSPPLLQEKMIVTVTAYYPTFSETDDDPCISASGVNICKTTKNICACPRKYPFGTRFLINGKIYECQDRLSLKYDNRIDLLVHNKQEMDKWGKRIIEVTIIK